MANELGYDPTDQNSFPYQANDPPFSANDLVLDPATLERAAELDIFQLLSRFRYAEDRPEQYLIVDMALRLFRKLTDDPAYEGIAYPDLFAAAIDTSRIWYYG